MGEKLARGIAKYSFVANGKYQVSLEENDEVQIMEFSSGWYRGKVLRTAKTGIFPANYVQISEEKKAPDALERSKGGGPVSDSALLVQVKKTLDEWAVLSSNFLLEGRSSEFFLLKERMNALSSFVACFCTTKQRAKKMRFATASSN